MPTTEEMKQIEKLLEQQIKPVLEMLEILQKEVTMLRDGTISTVVGVDALNDEERERSKHNHH